MVEEGGLPEEPQGVARGDPVVGVVLGVAVAGDDFVAVGEGAVHLGDVVGRQQVIGVEDEEAVKDLAIVGFDMAQQLLEGVALADQDPVKALVDHSAVLPGHLGGVVGAVVGHYEDRDQLAGVVLGADGVQQMADDRRLIPGGDQHRVAVEGCGAVGLVLFEEGHSQIEKLVGVADHKDGSQPEVENTNDFNRFHGDVPLSVAEYVCRSKVQWH